jgi:hypothetical protein
MIENFTVKKRTCEPRFAENSENFGGMSAKTTDFRCTTSGLFGLLPAFSAVSPGLTRVFDTICGIFQPN